MAPDTAANGEVWTDVPDDAPSYRDSYDWQPTTAATSVAAEGPRNPLLTESESHPPPSILQMSADLAYRAKGARLCGLGYHAWMPWLPIWVGDPPYISRYETYCVRCRHPEQFDA